MDRYLAHNLPGIAKQQHNTEETNYLYTTCIQGNLIGYPKRVVYMSEIPYLSARPFLYRFIYCRLYYRNGRMEPRTKQFQQRLR